MAMNSADLRKVNAEKAEVAVGILRGGKGRMRYLSGYGEALSGQRQVVFSCTAPPQSSPPNVPHAQLMTHAFN